MSDELVARIRRREFEKERDAFVKKAGESLDECLKDAKEFGKALTAEVALTIAYMHAEALTWKLERRVDAKPNPLIARINQQNRRIEEFSQHLDALETRWQARFESLREEIYGTETDGQ